MTPSIRIAIVADDLTGASDTAVQFGRHGWSACVALTDDSDITGEVVARSTASRALADHAAFEATARAVAGIDAERVYLKIDSTARGSIAGQIGGALEGWRTRHPDAIAVVCPAYPEMGRTVEQGGILVDGVPVDRTAIGVDPVTPVHEPSLVARIPRARVVDIADVASAEPGAVIVLDARSRAEIDALVLELINAGPKVVVAGSAGLAESFARLLPGERGEHRPARPGGPALIVVSSLNPVSHAQADLLISSLSAQSIVIEPSAAEAHAQSLVREPSPVTVLRTSLTRVGERDSGVADRVADLLAARAVDEIVARRPALVGLVGGDGARAVLRRLGAEGLVVRDAAVEGAPLMAIVGGPHDGLAVWTKAGGFGVDDTLIRILERTGAASAPDAHSPSLKEETP
ncbi:MAG: four-carbon acid sugar kinase family protein [Microcella sp.]|uniref:four-carbon acid sugar kinase family protein n=1 Tax=Microcella sp. TaxID=1913979 RepID=UPI00271C57ED|nr:four-carbon acid sugar kinase family protein [Microcella sp.]MDO8336990.1 four-carbon acid sugar kinase family protein [Microcella sp.]